MFESQFSASEEELDLENRITAPEFGRQDVDTEFSLRPKSLNEYIGQGKPVGLY